MEAIDNSVSRLHYVIVWMDIMMFPTMKYAFPVSYVVLLVHLIQFVLLAIQASIDFWIIKNVFAKITILKIKIIFFANLAFIHASLVMMHQLV